MKKTDISKRMKEKTASLLKAIVITVILDFICYAFITQFIGAGKVDGYYSSFVANLLSSIAATMIYALLFHWFYTTNTNKIYRLNVKRDDLFDWKKEGKSFFQEECIPFLILYGVFIVLFELIVTVTVLLNTRMHWFLVYIYAFLFPFRIADDKFNLFLAPILSVVILVILIMLLALFSRKRLHKKLQQM
ncbi:MAG: hypothetical protein IKJ74_04815 [Clostridia bacterium]|nr:hypothetical protein [Clostridia bacterium]